MLESTVLVIAVPLGVFGATKSVKLKLAEAPAASVAVVPVIVPVPPTAGLVRLNAGPEVWASETKVVLAGTRLETPPSGRRWVRRSTP